MVEYSLLGDEDLAERLFYHDLKAFETLYDRYVNLVYSIALRIVREPNEAQDLVQEIFTKLWRKPEGYTAQRAKFSTWLSSVARNRAIDEIRSRRRRNRYELRPPAGVEWDWPSPARDDPALTAETRDQRQFVISMVMQLPADQRQAIEMAYFGGLTQQEIAERLGQPLGTVKTRIRLGMQKLRATLGPKLRGELG